MSSILNSFQDLAFNVFKDFKVLNVFNVNNEILKRVHDTASKTATPHPVGFADTRCAHISHPSQDACSLFVANSPARGEEKTTCFAKSNGIFGFNGHDKRMKAIIKYYSRRCRLPRPLRGRSATNKEHASCDGREM